jgi:phosphoesterase RecJ-like protein
MLPKKLLAELRKKSHKTFLVSAHIHLEGDALGSELAMAGLLKALGKKVLVFNEDEAPNEYLFMPGIGSIRHDLSKIEYDAAILVDCSDISRIGKIQKVLRKDKVLINIDHHISNTAFGDINWVEPDASCACEMVYSLFKALGVGIKKDDAICLYTGILADTGSFKYKTTTGKTHLIAADLLRQGVDVYDINRRIYESMSISTVKDLGKIIGSLEVTKDGKVAWLSMRNNLIRKNPTLADETDAIIHFARAIAGVEVALLFKETQANREVRINLRSTGTADVNKLAQVFGGGGHRMASGATVKGTFRDVVKKVVLEAAKRVL